MVISLVNPHDVLFYPGKSFDEADYDESWLEGDIRLPETVDEDLSTKPTVQAEFLRIFNLTGKLKTQQKKRNYLNFYGNLMRSSDNYLVNVLDKLEETGLYDDTLIIRTADHGEMGLTHGGMRQKNFNFYEEATRVPLVYSNPKLFPKPVETDALVSHVDFLPTLASLAAAPKSARAKWQGVDYSSLVLHPSPSKLGPGLRRLHLRRLPVGPGPRPLSETAEPHRQHPRRALEDRQVPRRRTRSTKPPQWEMYDLKTDPLEKTNLAYTGYERSAARRRSSSSGSNEAGPGREDPPAAAEEVTSRGQAPLSAWPHRVAGYLPI